MKLSEVTGSGTKLSEATAPRMPDYDPATAMPVGDVPLGLQPSDVKEMAKGAVTGALGIGGDIEKALFPKQPNILPSSEGVGRFLGFSAPKEKGQQLERELGSVASGMFSPATLGRSILSGAKGAARVGERIAPGAVKRAQSLVERIAQPSDPNLVGNAIRQKVMTRYQPMFEARQKEFSKWLEQHDPKNQIFTTAEDQAAAEAAFDRQFAEKYKELSKDLNEFGDTLGKHATKSVKYANGQFKFDAKNLPADAFRSQASVESLKRLTKDDAFVNEMARDWTATELRRVTEPGAREGDAKKAAQAAREWFEKANQDWLQYLPEASKDARDFVDRFDKIASSRKTAKWIAGTGAVTGAAALGYHPLNWMRHQLGL